MVHPRQVNRLRHGKVIGVFGLERLEIGGDELARIEPVDHLAARAGESHIEVGKEAAVFERQLRVGEQWGRGRTGHLIEIAEVERPEMRPPALVEALDRAVFLAQVGLKRAQAALAEAVVKAAHLVIHLPAGNAGVAGEVFDHRPVDALGQLDKFGVGQADGVAQAVGVDMPIAAGIEHARVAGEHPGRRGARTGAQDDPDAVLVEQVDGALHPIEMDLPFAGFISAPGELAHAHRVDPGALHHLRILRPALFGPLFRVILNAVIHIASCYGTELRTSG